MDTLQACLRGPTPDNLPDAGRRHVAALADPQPRLLGVLVAGPHPDIAIEGLHGLGSDRGEADAAALPEDPKNAAVEVDVAAGLVVAGQHEIPDLRQAKPRCRSR